MIRVEAYPMPVTENRDLKNHAYHILKERLINCIYEPGSFLNEAQLAIDLGLSRTPVREAINRLESEGFVKVMPKKGIYVSDIQLSDVLQIFQARIEIEPVALRMAAPHLPEEELLAFRKAFTNDVPDIPNAFRLDTAMHLFIIEHCGNRYIIDMMHNVFDYNTKVVIASKQNLVQIHDARVEHLDIINTLIDKDVDKAVNLMRTHVETCRRAALDYFYSMEAYSISPSVTYKDHLKSL
jgi:DNA-binding GntR family transcriptional regulator